MRAIPTCRVAPLLGSLALFASLRPDQIAQLAEATTERALELGDILMRQGTAGASLCIIRAGVLEVSKRRDDGSMRTYGRIGPGEYLGEISMMSGDPRAITVTALTSAAALELPRAALEALLREDGALSIALERSIHRGLALLDQDDVARACQPLDYGGSILARIRAFLRGSAGGTT